MAAVAAFAPVSEPVAIGAQQRCRWHVIGSDLHPVSAELRARSARPRPLSSTVAPEPAATAVLLGSTFRWQDNALLLDGIAASRRDGGRLVLVHCGAGGASLLQVAAREDPQARTLAVELPEQPSPRAVRLAVSLACADPPATGELRVDNDGKVSRIAWRRLSLPAPRPPRDTAVRPGSVLVTGGLGGLGIRAAGVLASTLGVHPVLLDSVVPAEVPSDVANHLRRLSAGPAGVTTVRADVTDGDQLAAVLAEGRWPPLTAVVHCAGLLQAGPIAGFSSHDLAVAQQVKVDGLGNVLACLKAERLRHLVTFGSVTAQAPHRSMASYALANELLRRATMRAAQDLPNCATVAAEWSLWSGAGMAHQAAATGQARRMGMTPVSLRDGMATLLRLLSWPPGPTRATALLLLGEP